MSDMTMRLRDDVELSVLAEFGDPVLAETAGAAFQMLYETLCTILAIDSTQLDDHLDRGTNP